MSDKGVRPMKRHEEYYIRDGNICFVVEGTLFRLHRHFLERESNYFCAQLNPPGDEDGSPDNPYKIDNTTSDEFAQFVWVWYNPRYSFANQKKEKWITILRLATRWKFDEIRTLAIRQLEKLSLEPIEKIGIYKEHAIDDKLLYPCYVSLCRREKLPSPEEGRKLSMNTVLMIASAREQAIKNAAERGCRTPTTASVPEDVIQAVVEELFQPLTPHSNEHPVGMRGQATNKSCDAASESLVHTQVIALKQPTHMKNRRSITRLQ